MAIAVVLHSFEPVDRGPPRDYDRDATNKMAEFDANARLIAAAPDLLSVCRRLAFEFSAATGLSVLDSAMLRDAAAAINSAEGR